MSVNTAVCSKCGKPLKNVPSYLAEGDGAELFQCDNCFFPSCAQATMIPIREPGSREKRLDAIIEDLDAITPVKSR